MKDKDEQEPQQSRVDLHSKQGGFRHSPWESVTPENAPTIRYENADFYTTGHIAGCPCTDCIGLRGFQRDGQGKLIPLIEDERTEIKFGIDKTRAGDQRTQIPKSAEDKAKKSSLDHGGVRPGAGRPRKEDS